MNTRDNEGAAPKPETSASVSEVAMAAPADTAPHPAAPPAPGEHIETQGADTAPAPDTRPCLLEYSRSELASCLTELGQKAFRATQLAEWIWKHRAADFAAMSNLPPDLRTKLSERYTLRPLELVEISQSSNGNTRKFLSRLRDRRPPH